MLQEGKSCIFVGSECLCAGHVPSYVSRHWIIGLMREWWLNVLAQHPPPHSPPLSFQVLLLVLSSFHVCTRVCCNALRSRWMVRLQPHLPVYPIEPTSHAISTGMYQQQGAQCLLLISSSVPESEPCCLVQVLYPVSLPPLQNTVSGDMAVLEAEEDGAHMHVGSPVSQCLLWGFGAGFVCRYVWCCVAAQRCDALNKTSARRCFSSFALRRPGFDVLLLRMLDGSNNGNSKKCQLDYCLRVGTSPGSFKGMFYWFCNCTVEWTNWTAPRGKESPCLNGICWRHALL